MFDLHALYPPLAAAPIPQALWLNDVQIGARTTIERPRLSLPKPSKKLSQPNQTKEHVYSTSIYNKHLALFYSRVQSLSGNGCLGSFDEADFAEVAPTMNLAFSFAKIHLVLSDIPDRSMRLCPHLRWQILSQRRKVFNRDSTSRIIHLSRPPSVRDTLHSVYKERIFF